MTRRRISFLAAGTFLTIVSCGSTDANLGDGMGAVGSTGGSAGSSGGETKDAAVQAGGSAGSSSTGTGGASGSATGSGGGTAGGGTAGTIISVDSGSAEAGGALTWRVTCGDPVCRVPPVGVDVDSGIASCSADMTEGKPCTMAGSLCDPHGNCGQKMMCADHRLDVMCPISNRDKKQDIRYLSHEDLERLADEVSKVRLTTYTYRDPSLGADQHLGFIIEDNPQSPAVYPNQHHVDLYGYASMAVAALQVQEKQLRAQEEQMADLRRQLSSLRDELRAARDPSCRP